MSYTPTVWKTGDIVSSPKLNKIENAIADLDSASTELVSDVTDLKSEIDGFGDTYAKQDGSYDSMTVGNAKQLVATVGVEDKVPYLFRTTGGSADVGDRKTMEIVGGTVAWNQLVTRTTPVTVQTGTSSAMVVNYPTNFIADHIYYAHCIQQNSMESNTRNTFGANDGETYFQSSQSSRHLSAGSHDWIFAARNTSVQGSLYLWCHTPSVDTTYSDFQLFDLTQMFGSTIADYINTLETNEAGAGVAWFRKLFPKPYYAYDAGTLMSVKTSANITTGFNQFDKSGTLAVGYLYYDGSASSTDTFRYTDYIRIVGGQTYYVKGIGGSNPAICWYDANKNYIGGAKNSEATYKTITFPSTACYVRISFPKDNVDSLVLNLHWDGERDGEYEPYVSHEYALDPDLELRGIPKLDADNSLYYDGDTYEADGTVTRRYGIVDLGTLNWDRYSFSGNYVFYANVPDRVSKGLCINAMYPHTTETAVSSMTDDTFGDAFNSTYVYIKDDSYATAAAFKTAMSGVYLVYELATPATESADPYQTPQIVNDFGTEEFVDTRDVPIPVGHDTMYQANLRAKLEMAPDSPSGNGDYIVRHSNGQNAYVPITFPADELPAAPTEDGSYVLKVTVANGNATYIWEAQT